MSSEYEILVSDTLADWRGWEKTVGGSAAPWARLAALARDMLAALVVGVVDVAEAWA